MFSRDFTQLAVSVASFQKAPVAQAAGKPEFTFGRNQVNGAVSAVWSVIFMYHIAHLFLGSLLQALAGRNGIPTGMGVQCSSSLWRNEGRKPDQEMTG